MKRKREDACPPGQKKCGTGCINENSNCPTGGSSAGGYALAVGAGAAVAAGAPRAYLKGKALYRLNQRKRRRSTAAPKPPQASPSPAPAAAPRSPQRALPPARSAAPSTPRSASRPAPRSPQRALPPARSPQLALPPARSPQTPPRRKPLVTPAPSGSTRTLITPPGFQKKRASVRNTLRTAVSRKANALSTSIQGRIQSTQRTLNRAGRRAQVGAVRRGRQLKEVLTYQNPAKQRLNRMRLSKIQRSVGAAKTSTIGSLQAATTRIRNKAGAGLQAGRSTLRQSRRNLKAGVLKTLRRF